MQIGLLNGTKDKSHKGMCLSVSQLLTFGLKSLCHCLIICSIKGSLSRSRLVSEDNPVKILFLSRAKQVLQAENVTSVDIVKTLSILGPNRHSGFEEAARQKKKMRDDFRQEHMTFIPVIGSTVDVN